MKRRQALAALSAAAVATPFPSLASSPPLTIVVPFAPGASVDVTTRLVAQRVAGATNQTIVVDNRPGSNGIVAAEAVKRAPANGRTLLLANVGTNAINASLYERLSYSERDFAPVTTLWRFPSLLVVPATSPARTAAELVSLSRRSPQGLTFASAGAGSGAHLLGELFRLASNTRTVHVPYRGVAPALIDLMAGRIDFMFSSFASVQKQLEAGQLRALAVASTQRLQVLPDVPTLEQAGLGASIVLQQWFGLVAPAGTAPSTVASLHADFASAMRDRSIIDKLAEQGIEPVVTGPSEFATLIHSDTERLGRVVKAVGAKPD